MSGKPTGDGPQDTARCSCLGSWVSSERGRWEPGSLRCLATFASSHRCDGQLSSSSHTSPPSCLQGIRAPPCMLSTAPVVQMREQHEQHKHLIRAPFLDVEPCYRRSYAIGAWQVAALAGIDVLLMDTNATALERSRDGIAASLQRAVGKKKLDADVAEAALARIATHREMEVCSNAARAKPRNCRAYLRVVTTLLGRLEPRKS